MYMSLTVGMRALLAPTDKCSDHSHWTRTILKTVDSSLSGEMSELALYVLPQRDFSERGKGKKIQDLLIERQKRENHGVPGS